LININNNKLYPTRYHNGREILASRTTKHYITSKKLYNAKGKILFIIEVISFRRSRGKTIIEPTTIQNVTVEVPNVSKNFRLAIEKAKIKAKASHYNELDYDMTDFSPNLIKRFVNFRLIDWIVRYERLYSDRLKKPLLTFKSKISKRKIGNKLFTKRFNTVYRYYQVTNHSRVESKIEAESPKNIHQALNDYDLSMTERKGSFYSGDDND
jgi:hypothetical protein